MASGSVLARVGLVSAVSVILGISTLSPLLKQASDFGAPVGGPPLYQTAAAPTLTPAEQKPAGVEARGKPAKLASTALLSFPPRPAPASATTAVATPAAAPQPAAPSQQQPIAAAPLPAPSQQHAAATAEDPAPPPPPLVAESEPAPRPERRAAAPKRPKKPRVILPPIYTRAVQTQPL